MPRRNLVIVRAGNTSLHPEWLVGDADRTWDVVVNYFGDDPDIYKDADVRRMDSKGPKWPALHDLIEANPSFMQDYAYIWLPDDDLKADHASITTLFVLCEKYQLEVAQPSLTWDSYFGHITTLQSRRYLLRYTNYVEVMAPCLSAAMLQKSLPLFNSNLSGWGLDFVWTKLADHPETGLAIIDAVTVRHTRPVGGPNYQALRDGGISPWAELRSFCRAHGLDEAPIIATHAAILRDGTILHADPGRRRFALNLVAGYILALRRNPDPRRMLRRMAGMVYKALWNVPDRVSETPLRTKKSAPG